MNRESARTIRSIALLISLAASGLLALHAQQAAQPAQAQAATQAKRTIQVNLPTLKARFAAQAAPSGSPAPDVTCILSYNTKDNKAHECNITSGGGLSDGPQSTQCGTTCTDAGTAPNTCPGTDDTDPDDCGSTSIGVCTSDYSGCYPASAPDGSGLTDPSRQNTDPDSYGDGDSPSSATTFCQLFEAGLQKSCSAMPPGSAQKSCQYEACQKGNSCQGAQKTTCPAPPKGASTTALNDHCQAQYASNMAYCTTQEDVQMQTTCFATALVELNGCSNLSVLSQKPVNLNPRISLPH